MSGYAGIVITFFIVGGFLATLLLLAYILGPKNPTKTKQLPFECASQSVGDAYKRFNVRFYVVAMIFILFDVEMIFVYPWALVLEKIGWLGFIEMVSFMAVLGAGLIYVWKRNIFEWQ